MEEYDERLEETYKQNNTDNYNADCYVSAGPRKG